MKVAIYTLCRDRLAYSKRCFRSLWQNAGYPVDHYVIDNGSTDGSAEFFESVGARVIRNEANYSYPHCQNQGIAIAKHDWLGFLNNDIIVSPEWDAKLIDSMQANGLEVATICGIEQIESAAATRKLKRRWQRIKNFLGLFSCVS